MLKDLGAVRMVEEMSFAANQHKVGIGRRIVNGVEHFTEQLEREVAGNDTRQSALAVRLLVADENGLAV